MIIEGIESLATGIAGAIDGEEVSEDPTALEATRAIKNEVKSLRKGNYTSHHSEQMIENHKQKLQDERNQ